MMLTSVLGDYLNLVKEREFDLPFLALLPRLGFYDVHFTHGQVEFGKDFIAKRLDDGLVIQYSFQLKAGDINQADWRNNVMGQILESVLSGLSHPNFDTSFPHQAVLVITGRLIGNAALGLQNLNHTIKEKYNLRPAMVWDREILINYLRYDGIEGVYAATASGFAGYGSFYELYGGVLQGIISEEEIEKHSQQWISDSTHTDKRLIGAATEAEIIAQKCRNGNLCYEAVHAHLGVIRSILHKLQSVEEETETEQLIHIYDQAMKRLYSTCKEYVFQVRESWNSGENDLVGLINGPGSIIDYLVQCARITEITGWLFFAENDDLAKREISDFLRDFISHEAGCSRIPSDNYSVSLVFPVLALLQANEVKNATQMIRRGAVWMCDRYDDGPGIARFGSSPHEEIVNLVGYPLEFFPEQSHKTCFLATVLCDLAAFAGNKELYESIVNDIKALRIIPEYWQVCDTEGMYNIQGEDVISYPNVEYNDVFSSFEEFCFAEHIIHEKRSFKISDKLGAFSLMTMMIFLRDRYFPSLWPVLMKQDLDQKNHIWGQA